MKKRLISGLAGLCLGLLSAYSAQAEKPRKYDIPSAQPAVESRDSLTERIKADNIELRADFSQDELRDISEVLELYKNKVGDIKRFKLSLDKFPYNSEQTKFQSMTNATSYEPCEEFRGYSIRGATDPESLDISISPKKAIDGKFRYEQEKGLIPTGEEGKNHNFQWVLVHEIAHNIMHQTGLNDRFRLDFTNENDALYKNWQELQLETAEKCKPLEYKNGDFENVRPEGYPSKYSYFANSGEQVAELISYDLFGCDYAKQDKVLAKKLDFVESYLREIKQK